MQDAKEEVRARLSIEDVIGEYVHLKKSGRNFKGLSPFTSEKTPSFFVSPDKQIWHDFSSNKGGDVFSFVMEVEGVEFRESLEQLARKAGVDLSMYDNKGAQAMAKLKKRLLHAHELATSYYQQSLVKNNHAAEYVFKKRGLSKQVVQEFVIGYSPNTKDALVSFLKRKGFTVKELSQAGLVNRFDGDLFRGRMVVPLMDGSGQVIGFTGRIIDDSDSGSGPKYLNTPQTLLYDKSRHVFGLSQAKKSIRTSGYSVIVEGNLDVVSSHQAGVTQVVATAGTAMTEYHLKALLRLSSQVRLAFDSDKAGLAATERAISIAQNVGAELSIITLPDNAKDPDELVKKDVKLWVKAIDKAEPAVDWVLGQYLAKEDLKTAAGKRRFSTAALNVISVLRDPVEQEHYLNLIAERTDVSVEALKSKISTNKEQSLKRYKTVSKSTEPIQDPNQHQDSLLAVALVDTTVRSLLEQLEIKTMLDGDNRQAVANYLRQEGKAIPQDTPEALQDYDEYVKMLMLRAEARYADWDDQDRYSEAARLVRKIIVMHKQKLKDELINQLRDAETMGNDDKAVKIRTALNEIIREVKSD